MKIKTWVTGILALSIALAAFAQSYKPEAGYVPGSDTAIQIAEAVLAPVYGKSQIESFGARLRDGVWIVSGTLHCAGTKGSPSARCVGGVAIVEISRDDGRILSMIHGK
jgi:NTF2 fold immunity protein of polymorphic toxin system component